MIAYVFWHWPRAGTDAQVYERRLARFQETLAAVPVDGFRDSAIYRLTGAPWFPPNTTGYEECYLLHNSCAMDLLNDAAVSESCRAAHDQTVEFFGAGAAGLYRLRHGHPSLHEMIFRSWIRKPPGVRYPEFDALLLPALVGFPCALWRRQMVLGPTPEFCLHTAAALELPSNLVVYETKLEIVWQR